MSLGVAVAEINKASTWNQTGAASNFPVDMGTAAGLGILGSSFTATAVVTRSVPGDMVIVRS